MEENFEPAWTPANHLEITSDHPITLVYPRQSAQEVGTINAVNQRTFSIYAHETMEKCDSQSLIVAAGRNI